MRKHLLAALLVSGGMLLSAVSVTFADQSSSSSEGPTVTDSSPVGYYLWNDDTGSHLRTHGPGSDEHDFDAVLRTDGTFDNVDPVRLEAANLDRVDVHDGGHELVIHFHTFGGVDGVDFTMTSGQRLSADLRLDQQAIATSGIFIGDDGTHPNNDPFTLPFKDMNEAQ
jgi:hypothetical protein